MTLAAIRTTRSRTRRLQRQAVKSKPDAPGQQGILAFAAPTTGRRIKPRFAGFVIYLARRLDRQSQQIYAVYDFWHTSPNFFLIRVGLLLVILAVAHAWFRWGAGRWGFSPLVQLGQTSLLVYWVHIEFVYGRFSILPKHSGDIRTASFGMLTIFLAMLLLSALRTSLGGVRREDRS